METEKTAKEVAEKLTQILETAKTVLIRRLRDSSNSTYEYIKKLIEYGLIPYYNVGNIEGTVFKDRLSSKQIHKLQELHKQLHK